MDHLRLLTFVTDIGLVSALVYFCYRCMRASAAQPGLGREVVELGSTLRVLVKEAERASRSLNEELIKRQQTLEQLIFDAGSAEQRLNRAIENASERKTALESSLSKARSAADDLQNALSDSSKRPRETNNATQAPQTSYTAQKLPAAAVIREEGEEDDTTARVWSNQNIFGDEIGSSPVPSPEAPARPGTGASPRPAQQAYKPLSTAIEKQVSNERRIDHDANAKLQEIYGAAEEMLKAGLDLSAVAARTKLPIEEVRLLAHMVDQEREAARNESDERADPRLGVLGTMRRQVQVL